MTGTKLYRQIGAALLLLLLTCTTAVQLTHSHTAIQAAGTELKKQPPLTNQQSIATPGADTKCFVHEYQLVKDADFYCAAFHPLTAYLYAISKAEYSWPLITAHRVNFENRGPPAV